uniref:Antistasin-like factor F n=1 Tax=Hirudo verbana TaxID=311461 RepID=A0A7T0PA91_9ANNE|nr:antistasin-like factor F [Hirudo verbana]
MFLLTIAFVYFAFTGAQGVTACPMLACAINCTYSNKLDANGCRTCECFDPCQDKVCPFGEECKVENASAVCVKKVCPLVTCLVPCKSGYRLDYDGCQTCECVDPCEYPKCEKGQDCESKVVQCFRAPCYPVAECSPACPQIRCFLPCKSGYREDFHGCQTCECVDPCEYPKCQKGEVCKRQQVWCIVAPCYDVYECIKGEAPY